MIDCGAQENYISPRLKTRLRKYSKEKVYLYLLNMVDGTPVEYDGGWIREEVRDVRLEISGYKEISSFDFTPIKYDLILGLT